jgi:hypothetical protein
MNWRPLDYRLVGQCVQITKRSIDLGILKASDLLADLVNGDEKLAQEMFEAWRTRFLDRIEKENQDDTEGFLKDINDDLDYCRKGTGGDSID